MKEKIFALSENFANEYINMRSLVTPEERKEAFFMFPTAEIKDDPIFSDNGENAIIKIEGPLSRSGPDAIDKYLGYGGTSYSDIISACNKYKESSSVKNIYLEFDTPGGECAGCMEAAQSIAELRAVKNVITINKDCMASAGYWLGSQGSKIYGTSPLVETGSIGVVWVLGDYDRGFDDKEYGMARVRITSKNAKNKRPDITSEDGRKWMQDMIDGIEKYMIADIAKGRGITSEDVINNYGQGSMFLAKDLSPDSPDALKNGMIDGIIDYKPEEILKGMSSIFSTELNSTNPAMRDNITEVTHMSLKDLLAQDPAATIEYEAALAEAKKAGYEKGKADMIEISSKAAVFADSKEYPAQVKAIALEVMQGKKSVEALDSIVATADMIKELSASKEAEKEQGEDTKPEDHAQPNSDGVISSLADIQAEAKRLKGVI